MAFIFVSKSGNDFNPGTAESPKLTITAALSGAVNGDTIIVRAGVYKETATYRNVAYSVTVSGMGYVVIDGEGIRANAMQTSNTTSNNNKWTGIHFRNTTGPLINVQTSAVTITFEDCEFSEAPNVFSLGQFNLFRCITRDLTALNTAAWETPTTTPNTIMDCLFENIPSVSGAIRWSSATAFTPVMYRNIFNRCPCIFFHHSTSSAFTNNDFNVYDFGHPNTVIRRGGGPSNIFTSLAAWQALGNLVDPHSISASGDFIDLDKRLLCPRPGGNLTTLDPGGGVVGPLRTAFGMSNNVNATHFASGTFVNTQINASGNIILTLAPSGMWTSRTVDLGAVVRLRSVRVSTLFEDYPTDVVDVDNNDTNPNELNVEYRISSVSQADAESKPWLKVRRGIGGLVQFPQGTQARWIQIRLFLRSDGVAA